VNRTNVEEASLAPAEAAGAVIVALCWPPGVTSRRTRSPVMSVTVELGGRGAVTA
jgi:hypothetical protein